jgi:hypothetical protein
MIVNDIWEQFCQSFQGNVSTDLSRKTNALNMGYDYMLKRMLELLGDDSGPKELLVTPTNISNTVNTNYIALPSDFVKLHKMWYRSGENFLPFGSGANIDYDDLINRVGESFFDTDVTGTPTMFALKDPYIYFDTYFDNQFEEGETVTGDLGGTATVVSDDDTYLTVTGCTCMGGEFVTGDTSGAYAEVPTGPPIPTATFLPITRIGGTKEIKLQYWQTPDDIVLYDRLFFDTLTAGVSSGDYTNYILEGGTSNASARIKYLAVTGTNRGYFDLYTEGKDSTFAYGETVTILGAAKTAVVEYDITRQGSIFYEDKVQSLEVSNKYKMLLAQCAALMWLHLKGSNEVQARSVLVDNLIYNMGGININRKKMTWGMM